MAQQQHEEIIFTVAVHALATVQWMKIDYVSQAGGERQIAANRPKLPRNTRHSYSAIMSADSSRIHPSPTTARVHRQRPSVPAVRLFPVTIHDRRP